MLGFAWPESRWEARWSRLLVLSAVGALLGCSPYAAVLRAARPQQLATEPAVLEATGDLVPFVVKARVPAKILKWEKDYTYKLEISYRYDEVRAQSAALDKPQLEYVGGLEFRFGDYQPDSADRRWLVARKAFSFPFEERKTPGHVVARGYVTRNGRDPRRYRRESRRYLPLGAGIITTNRLVVSRPRLDFTPETYKPTADSGLTELPIYFPPGMALFNGQYGTNAAALAEFITENVKTQTVRIVASHSPDDVDTKNPRLALLRARSIEKYYKDLLDKYGYVNSAQSVRFGLRALHNDWSLLLDRVQGSALPPEQIEEILDIVNGPGSYNAKAEKLETCAAAEYLELYVYPMMRYALVTIKHAKRPPRPDYELYLVAQKIAAGEEAADALTEDELRYAASLTPLLEDKRRIYEGALKTGLSWAACHNLGLIYLLMAEKEVPGRVRTIFLKKAVKNLTYAAHRNPSDAETWYHLATAQQRAGNVLEALHAYDYAVKGTGQPELMRQVFADKAALELVAGQPDDALTSLKYAAPGYQSTMNHGLAALLLGNYATAAAQYEAALTLPDQTDNGLLATYCRAVTAARAHDEAALGQWLARAVALDPATVDRAARDLEFRGYQQSAAFLGALRR